MCLHLPSLLHDYFHPSHIYMQIKAFQVCSNLDIHNIFTSDTKFTREDLPRDMRFVLVITEQQYY